MFGAKLAYVNHVTQQGQTPDMPETGGESGVAPEEFPHLSRAIQESEYLGWDEMLDRGLRALVHGPVVSRHN